MSEYTDARNKHVSNLRSMLAREHRWMLTDPDDDRQELIDALQWACRRLEGLPENWTIVDDDTAGMTGEVQP